MTNNSPRIKWPRYIKNIWQVIQHALRTLHLLNMVEYFRCQLNTLHHAIANQNFKNKNPEFNVPPSHLAYDAYAVVNWDYYYRSGLQMAKDLVAIIKKSNVNLDGIQILEWGCGPGRVIRHFPECLEKARVFGSDYNLDSIKWCRDNLKSIDFQKNSLMPPLPYEDNQFNFIYANSVLTHLNEDSCLKWMDEIKRILKNDGIFFFTTHGHQDAEMLLKWERKTYESEGLYIRSGIEEGKKMYGAWHHPDYVKKVLLKNYDLIEYIPAGGLEYISSQDAWVVKKKR